MSLVFLHFKSYCITTYQSHCSCTRRSDKFSPVNGTFNRWFIHSYELTLVGPHWLPTGLAICVDMSPSRCPTAHLLISFYFLCASLFWFSYLSFSLFFFMLFLQHCVVAAATKAPHCLPLPLPPWSRTNIAFLYEWVDIFLLYNLCSVWNAPSYYYVTTSFPTPSASIFAFSLRKVNYFFQRSWN